MPCRYRILCSTILLFMMTSSGYGFDDEKQQAALIRGNVQATDLTAVVRIDRITRTGPQRGYALWHYKASVVDMIHGPRLDQIEFTVVTEADQAVKVPEEPYLVSLCSSGKSSFRVPDNGFMMSATSSLISVARASAESRRAAGNTTKQALNRSWCD